MVCVIRFPLLDRLAGSGEVEYFFDIVFDESVFEAGDLRSSVLNRGPFISITSSKVQIRAC